MLGLMVRSGTCPQGRPETMFPPPFIPRRKSPFSQLNTDGMQSPYNSVPSDLYSLIICLSPCLLYSHKTPTGDLQSQALCWALGTLKKTCVQPQDTHTEQGSQAC